MFKRGQGFDCICYEGDGVSGRQIPHSMNKVPEMMWVKNRSTAHDWIVYHKGLNGGTNPQNYFMRLNTTVAESSNTTRWNDTAPNNTYFTLGDTVLVNENTKYFIAMLFASIEGVSKVGYYSGSNSSQTISLGFAPRFVLLKNIDAGEYWYLGDSVRGLDNRLALNNANAQSTMTGSGGVPWLQSTSSGVTIIGNELTVNQSGSNYIYYAHA